MTGLSVTAHAKLTLSLRVTGVRADGYHEIDASMVTVTEPHDRVELERSDATHLMITGPFAEGVPSDATNLAWRAVDALGCTAAIRIRKGIPHGAGLGGGSADAAAVLVGLRSLLELDIDDRELTARGARLGADVAFCLVGGAARVGGVGEQVTPIARPDLWCVIATPPFGCATAAVYREWDRLGGPRGRVVGKIAGFELVNDLELAAHSAEPKLAAFRDQIEATTGRRALLAGSGSSYAIVTTAKAEAESVCGALDELGITVWMGAPCDRGAAERC